MLSFDESNCKSYSAQLHYFVQSQVIIYVLVLLPTVRWIQMMPSTVCFEARDDSYGFSRTSKAGNIITFKLTYKSGYVTCHSQNPSYQSKWGCLQNRLIPKQMATLTTDKNRNLLLPKSDFLSDYWDCKFYSHTCGVEIEDRNLELTCLTFGKGDWKTANHFPSSIHL